MAFFEDRDGDGALGAADAVVGRVTPRRARSARDTHGRVGGVGVAVVPGRPSAGLLDGAAAVAESDETNNVGRAGETCQVRPAGPPFSLREEWAWTTASVLSTPVVGDLERRRNRRRGVRQPAHASPTTDGQLRAVSGRSGLPLFSVLDPANDLNPAASPAIGDIDGDGRPEIVAVAEQGNQLLAFEHDGTLKWSSAALELASATGAPFLADLDGDGRAEIVVGRQVLNGDGTLRWTGTGRCVGRSPATGARSVAADLDLDGTPEVIAGASAYRADGTLLWSAPAVGDGVVAVANLDSDPYPEIVRGGQLALAARARRQRALGPGGRPRLEQLRARSRSPTSTATRSRRSASAAGRLRRLRGVRPVRWSATTERDARRPPRPRPSTSTATARPSWSSPTPPGCTSCSGRDGSVVGELPTGSCSNAYAYPVVADVDGDGKAEIVMGSYACAGSPATGVRAFGEARDGWVRARAAWSQSEYARSRRERLARQRLGARGRLRSPPPT